MSEENFGDGIPEPQDPGYREPEGRYSVPMPERILLMLLRDEVTRLSSPDGTSDLRRFFSHFFDPMIGERERNTYVDNFQRQPPTVTMGYPRTGSRFPCLTVILESDDEDQEALDYYLGETQPGDPADDAHEYAGALFRKTLGIHIFAEHPDVCLYLYHFAKAVIAGAHLVLAGYGLIDPKLSGSELSPQENYLPENMFVRRLGVTVLSLETSPLVLRPDPARVRVAGISSSGTIVSGVRGGVTVIASDSDDE
jgi:hypothetical protein